MPQLDDIRRDPIAFLQEQDRQETPLTPQDLEMRRRAQEIVNERLRKLQMNEQPIQGYARGGQIIGRPRLSAVGAIHGLIHQRHAKRMTDILRRIHGGGDNVLIAAKRGEYVIPEHIVRKKGVKYFDKMIGGKPPKITGPTGMPHYLQGGQIESGLGDFVEPTPIPYGTPNANPTPMTVYGGNTPPPVPQIPGGRLSRPDFSGFGQRAENFLNSTANRWGGFGTTPSTGLPAFGPTQIPTNWTNYPGVGLVPFAVPQTPISGDYGVNSTPSYHSGQTRRNQ